MHTPRADTRDCGGIKMEECKLKYGIKVDKNDKGMWSLGICLSHWFEETYIYINLIKWSISIGKMYLEVSHE